MDREIVAASFSEARGRLGGSPVEGPDEDAFTLACEAFDELPWAAGDAPRVRAHVVGELPEGAPDDLAEGLGVPGLQRVDWPGTTAGLWDALAAASQATGAGTEAVVLFESGPPQDSISQRPLAGALALGLSRRDGIRYVGHTPVDSSDRNTPSFRSGTDLLFGDRDAGDPLPPLIRYLEAEPASPSIERSSGSSIPANRSRLEDGRDPGSIHSILELWQAVWSVDGPRVAIGIEGPNGSSLVALERHAPIASVVRRSASSNGTTREARTSSTRPSALPANLSEGAYVPRATYRSERAHRWRLAADRCSRCGEITFPSHGRCASCGSTDTLTRFELPRRDLRVEASTIIHAGAQPTEFDRQVEGAGPYEVVIASVCPGVRITLQVSDTPVGSIGVGDRIDAKLRRLIPMEGEWRYGLKAVPAVGQAMPERSSRSPSPTDDPHA
ncbi:MAG: hypothetical protein L3J95_01995 [Thermoplasmata archaeon]|nr:hypothetical protein [Thermoplasmata archaeon]MCI4359183.1 hypothetical protein [Thermoplasmata archaeon]